MYFLTQIDQFGKVVSEGQSNSENILGMDLLPTASISLNEPAQPGSYYANGWVAILPQPSEHHVFNWSTKHWEDPRTLQDFKDAKWDSIKKSREASINAPLVTPYGTFDSDPKSRQNITDAILLLKSLEDLGSPGTIDFTLADDTARTLNTGEMVMVGLLLGQKIQAAHAQARALRGALDLATTKEEVEAITWQVTT